MKIHHVDQGTPEWHKLRLGLPTASQFNRIMTRTGKPSAQAEKYLHELLGEWATGKTEDHFESQWMNRGKHLEDEAVAYFEMQMDLTTDPGGFVTNEAGTIGCSPDRLVYVTGDHSRPIAGLEIKCPSPSVHIGYLLGSEGIAEAYTHQIQGCLWVTKLEKWHTLSYHPGLPPALFTVTRDFAWAQTFAPLMHEFLDRFDTLKALLRDRGTQADGDRRSAAA